MKLIESIVDSLSRSVWGFGIPVAGETVPLVVLLLLGTGLFLTLRLRFVQFRRLGHGFAVSTGRYDDPDEPGDVSHFQALSTALSATVGIGNIAGVAIALHYGGPGALFWMWVTALLGMAVKFTEVTLAQTYRNVGPDADAHKWEGSVAGGPMYYIEKGLGRRWRPLAVLFALLLGTTAFFTGNAIQANTVADTLQTTFNVPPWITGLIAASLVAAVILGGITRIGRVTSVLAPLMAAIYVTGAFAILVLQYDQILPSLQLIFSEAFRPTAGIAGTGAGAFVVTMMWGVKRGLFSNEAGQGSAPIAHAAAKTDEPVSEGVVGLVEPFIDTIVICSMTGLVVIITGAWNLKLPTEMPLRGGDSSYIVKSESGAWKSAPPPREIRVDDGHVVPIAPGEPGFAWHDVAVDRFFIDASLSTPFSGSILPAEGIARTGDGRTFAALHGNAVESAAPLTMLGFRRGLSPIGDWGHLIVLLSVLLFAISTAISWSYYGDRCAFYVFGRRAVLPYKIVYVIMHFVGAVVPLTLAWELGDAFLGIVIVPNLIAIVLLSGKVRSATHSYFERKPWITNRQVHLQREAEKRMRPKA